MIPDPLWLTPFELPINGYSKLTVDGIPYIFFEVDPLIVANIILIIFMQISSLALGGIEMLTAGTPNAEIFLGVLVIIWLAVVCLVGGTINIMMAIKLMKL